MVQIQQPALADRQALQMVVPSHAIISGHFSDFRLGVAPRFGRRFSHQRGDPQAELQRGQVAAKRLAEMFEPFYPLAHVGKRFAPEQLHVGLGCGDLLSRFGSTAEVKPGMRAVGACGDTW